MNICTAANSKYVRYLYVMLASLFANNADGDIHVYVLHRDFTPEDRDSLSALAGRCGKTVEFIWVDETAFGRVPTTEKFSLETYFRLMLPGLLPPSVRRILYLDVDIAVRGDLRGLYDADLEGRAFGACRDFAMPELDGFRRRWFRRYDDLRYFNSGVMVWDMEKVRERYSFAAFMAAAEALGNGLPYVDQEILNYAVYDDVTYLDGRNYNYMAVRYYAGDEARYAEDARIVHYAGCAPWRLGPKNPLYALWWDYAERTPFYEAFLREQPSFETEALFCDRRNREIADIQCSRRLLKGTERLRRRLSGGVRYALYGAGQAAEWFWDLLEEEGMENLPVAVMDVNRAGQSFHDIRVQNEFGWAEAGKEYLLLVTPTGYGDELAREVARRAPENVRTVPLAGFLHTLAQT